MQEDFIFNVIYQIWYNTSSINRSVRVCLNRSDLNIVLINFKPHAYIFLCSFLIPRVFNTSPEIRDKHFGNFYQSEFYFLD